MSIAGWIKPVRCGICEKKLDPRFEKKARFAFGINWCAECVERLMWRTFDENHIGEPNQ